MAAELGLGSRHHLIVVADIEGFGDQRRTGPHLQAVRIGLDAVMRAAFVAAGLQWDDCYREMRGDAVVALAPAEADKTAFLEMALPTLVMRLRVHNDTHPEAQRIRLRLALHAGEVGYDIHGVSSASLIRTFRLCDAPALKTALARSPGVLAVIASDVLFDDVIRHTPAAAPATWRPVPIAVKEVDTTGWLTLPDHPYPPDPPVRGVRPVVDHPFPSPGRVVPRQLPAAVRDFTGRAVHLTALDALIPTALDWNDSESRLERDRLDAQAVVITAVDGAGGIGKTTLALHWAHRIQDRFQDGTLHVNLRGYGPGAPVTPSDALSGFLRALGIAARAIPSELEDQSALLRSLLAGKRVLMVLDNARSPEQIRPLLPGSPGCMVVVTSRDSLTGLVITDAAHRLTLDLLDLPEALTLVTGILGDQRAAAEPDAVRELIRLCARLPLALRIAATRAAAHPHLSVADVVAELADDHTRLEILSETGDERAAVRAVFDWSYEQLPAEQARLFRRLGLHPGPDLTLPAAAAVAKRSPAETRPLLAALVSAHLIEPAAGGRYRFHDLLRAYAASQAHHHDTSGDRHQALESLLAWYTHTVCTADQYFFHLRTQMPAVVAEPSHPHSFSSHDEAWAWLTSERTNILAALQHAADRQLDHHTVPLAHACRFLASGAGDRKIDCYTAGIAAAQRVGNRVQEAVLLLIRGEAETYSGRWEKSRIDFDRAVTLAEQLDDRGLLAKALHGHSNLLVQQGKFAEALRWLNRTLPLTREVGTTRMEALVNGALSTAHLGLGHLRLALKYAERNLRLRRQADDFDGEAWALTQLARIRQELGDLEQAVALCRDAIAIGRSIPLHRDETVAEPLVILAACLYDLGHTAEAIVSWQEAAAVYDETGYPYRGAEVRQRLQDVQVKP
ncbi:tetratricopeptide (TPR) repeat protein [Amycolatopsis lexingtonensis]|uniref:Tetratricopeptide (TPR) repeat protein n=1 Tax=Amycolatopsis lexingtonensis TaxID=218822 RepID=A0ABR9HQL0_9PSEU|nr:tetratricopeptide repeat protein [Amycolatopsis lexingtonensis]MBE1493211.1 tetratricopeptide (TPR) repeat protein [Amycolatopsis lexingtonensis]